MTDYAAVLRELMIAGYQGADLLAAFERLCVAIGGKAVEMLQNAPASPPRAAERRRKAGEPDRRQLNMMLPSDGGQAKAAPLTAAERQAKRRASLKSVTLRDINAAQAVDFVEESRNVTTSKTDRVTPPDSGTVARDGVTRRGKKKSPHTPLRKTLPPNPPCQDLVTVHWADPLIPFLETIHGQPFKRFGSGRTVRPKMLAEAQRLLAEACGAAPLHATGTGG